MSIHGMADAGERSSHRCGTKNTWELPRRVFVVLADFFRHMKTPFQALHAKSFYFRWILPLVLAILCLSWAESLRAQCADLWIGVDRIDSFSGEQVNTTGGHLYPNGAFIPTGQHFTALFGAPSDFLRIGSYYAFFAWETLPLVQSVYPWANFIYGPGCGPNTDCNWRVEGWGPNACGGGGTPTPPPTSCVLLSENFDGVTAPARPSGWTASRGTGPADPLWVTSTVTPHTPPNDAFTVEPGHVLDNRLDSPGVAIISASAQVSFRNNFNMETAFDGGVLEVSSPNINGGAFTDLTNAAVGGGFVAGGYTAAISTGYSSPIAGRPAWTGNSAGYINTVANLGPNVAGQNIKLRFRMGSDTSVSGAGWRIDTLVITDLCPGSTITRLANLSTRGSIGIGDSVMIGGFIIQGTQSKKVILRAIGPSLAQYGIAGALEDPVLELHGPTGLLTLNDDWRDSQQGEIEATGLAPVHSREAAIVRTLAPGAYTAIVRGSGNTTGIALVEIYDLDPASSKLANISTRCFVKTAEEIMIAGLILVGQNPLKVIVRAIGPSLPLSGRLGNPTLELRNGNGALIAANDNWRSNQEVEILATNIPPSNDLESAIVRDLTPGNYTAIVRGVNSATGIAVVEAYALH